MSYLPNAAEELPEDISNTAEVGRPVKAEKVLKVLKRLNVGVEMLIPLKSSGILNAVFNTLGDTPSIRIRDDGYTVNEYELTFNSCTVNTSRIYSCKASSQVEGIFLLFIIEGLQ